MASIPAWVHSRYWCFTRAGLWALEVERLAGGSPVLDPARGLAGAVSVRPAGERDVIPLSRAMRLPEDNAARRLAQGKQCYVAEVGGQIASYGWLSLGQETIPELERVIQPAPGEAYVWDCFTLPEYRGQGLMPAILRQIAAALRRGGQRRAWAVILQDNHSSQRAFHHGGFVLATDAVYMRLLLLRHLRLSAHAGAPRQLAAAARRLLT